MDKSLVATALSGPAVRENIAQSVLTDMTELRVLENVSSTNDYLLKLPASKRQGFVVCAANRQTAGRGRKGREWQSPADANIYLSVGRNFPGLSLEQMSCISIACGVAVCRVLESAGLRPGVKWPNDILLDGKKLAGILVEIKAASDAAFVVIGIGLNVAMPPQASEEIEQPWTDLKAVLSGDNQLLNRNILIGKLVNELYEACELYEQSAMAGFIDDWQRYDVLKQRDVIICDPEGNETLAQVTGMGSDCSLRVTMDGLEQSVYAADVKLKLGSHDRD